MKSRSIAALTLAGAFTLAFPAAAVADHHCARLPDLKLTVKKNHLDLNDNRPICTTVPGTFKVKINNPPGSGVEVGAGDVTARGKIDDWSPPPSATMEGDNSADKEYLVVEVKGSAAVGDEFGYWIEVEGVGTLDPTVRAIDTEERGDLTYRWAVESLDLLGVDPELAEEILRPLQPQAD